MPTFSKPHAATCTVKQPLFSYDIHFSLSLASQFYRGVVFIPVAMSLLPGRLMPKVAVRPVDESAEEGAQVNDRLTKRYITELATFYYCIPLNRI